MGREDLLIGEVADRSGISRKALRLYELRGILPKPRRTQSGYRVYPPDVLGVLHFVTQARRLGLTLKEISHIVALRCANPGPCVHVRGLLEQKLADLDNLRQELRTILKTWDASSARRGVVCQQIEGGKLPWLQGRSAPRAPRARKSSWTARRSALATASPSRRQKGGQGLIEEAKDMKVTLCTECENCPEIELTDKGVKIGEEGNVALLTHKEWNLLVDLIQNGQLTKV